jgi:two-component system sensor histidine kinase SaeS
MDVLALALLLPASGIGSLLIGAAAVGWARGHLPSLRLRLLLGYGLGLLVVLTVVVVTSMLMFLNTHDLMLLLLLLTFSSAISLAFGYSVASGLAGEIRTLTVTARRLADGDWSARVRPAGRDEVGQLASTFDQMANQLQRTFARERELEAARRELIAGVSHDLRTPLATTQAMVESVLDEVVTEPSEVRRFLRLIHTDVQLLSRLIDDLFELSQIDSGTLELKPESSSIGDLVSDTLEALRPQAEQRRLKLQGELNGRLPSVPMDVPRMQRVLYNLVQNALRHTPPDGTVIIRAVDAGSEIEISVADTGEGVDAEELARVFERFYRGSRARSRQEAGSGLGLTVAKGIVELHGGRIWADSSLGKGSTFVFTIPKPAGIAPNL